MPLYDFAKAKATLTETDKDRILAMYCYTLDAGTVRVHSPRTKQCIALTDPQPQYDWEKVAVATGCAHPASARNQANKIGYKLKDAGALIESGTPDVAGAQNVAPTPKKGKKRKGEGEGDGKEESPKKKKTPRKAKSAGEWSRLLRWGKVD